jgi:ABC-type transporter Mla maintaining outer membrane lipid asymmetry ATPase subunit MlaF
MSQILEKIEISNVGMNFDGQTFTFQNLSAHWCESGNWEILSEQGLGKSLLLQIVGGILTPTQGKVMYNDTDLFQSDFESTLPLRLQVGYTFDLGGLLHNQTIFDNLMLPLLYHKRYSDDEGQELINTQLEKFQIIKFRDLRPSFVSGSVRKMTVLLRSLLFEPRFLILDDPFVGLSDFQKNTFIQEIEEMRSKTGFLSLLLIDSTQTNFLKRDGYFILKRDEIIKKEERNKLRFGT